MAKNNLIFWSVFVCDFEVCLFHCLPVINSNCFANNFGVLHFTLLVTKKKKKTLGVKRSSQDCCLFVSCKQNNLQ